MEKYVRVEKKKDETPIQENEVRLRPDALAPRPGLARAAGAGGERRVCKRLGRLGI